MTDDAPGRLYSVTGDHVVDVPPVAPAAATAPPEPVGHRPARLPVLLGAGAGLAVVLVLLGRQPWPLPVRDGDGLADVPQSLLTFLLLGAAVCVWSAGRLVRPARTLPSAGAAHLWWGLLAGAAAVSLAADLSLASFAGAGIGQPPGDLVVRGLVPVVPAVLAGLLAADAGRTARIRAALGTGLVTVPLTASAGPWRPPPRGRRPGWATSWRWRAWPAPPRWRWPWPSWRPTAAAGSPDPPADSGSTIDR